MVFFSFLPGVSLTKGSPRLVGENKQMFCSRTPERKKNSRRATRKRLLKKGLCKRESVFFILPTSVLLYRAFRCFFHAKEIDAATLFTLPPNFLTPPYNRVSARGRALQLRKDIDRRVFFPLFRTKKSPVRAAILFHRTLFHKCGRSTHPRGPPQKIIFFIDPIRASSGGFFHRMKRPMGKNGLPATFSRAPAR